MAADLAAILLEAQTRGLVGPRDVPWHITHAERYMAHLPRNAHCLDLGSGGGLPGLPVAIARPDLVMDLVDARDRSVQWLRLAVGRLELDDRVHVVHSRAESLPERYAGAADVVMARGFGPPSDLAECAAPLLRTGGRLVVSAADAGEEWPADGLALLGFGPARIVLDDLGAIVVTVLGSPCGPDFPRRPKARMAKPLW
jgi:16S rRNA (guanine527-N7)-methyltransferase